MFLNNTNRLLVARQYVAAGIAVFPVHSVVIDPATNKLICTCRNSACKHPGKHPAGVVPKGHTEATTDIKKIDMWWGKNNLYNIGIVPGLSGFNVIDIDPKNNGDSNLDKLIDQYGEMGFDRAPSVRTGSGGNHYWFKADPNDPLTNASGSLPEGIDVRGSSGYVVAPPSHHACGQHYEWENIVDLQELQSSVEPLHPSFLKLIKTKKQNSISESDRLTQGDIVEGQRNNTLTSIAGRYYAQGFNHDKALALCLVDNEKCSPPLSNAEVETIVASVGRYHRTSQETKEWQEPLPVRSVLLPVEPFMIEMLPTPLQDYVKDIVERTQVSADFIAIPLILMFSSLIGAGCRIRPKSKDTWSVVPNLWGGIISDPGTLKSNSIAESLKSIGALAEKAHQKYLEDKKKYDVNLELYEINKAALSSSIKNMRKDKINKPDKEKELDLKIEQAERGFASLVMPAEPKEKRYKTNDSTIEMLQNLLACNSRGLLVERDELPSLLAGWEMPGREGDRGFFLQSWNGDSSYTVDRIGRGTTHVPNLSLSLIGSAQPAKILAYITKNISGLANDGLIQRFQMLVYPDQKPEWEYVDKEPNAEARGVVSQIASTIDSMDFIQCGAKVGENGVPFFSFAPDAQEMVREWFSCLETTKMRGDEEPIIKEHLAKYRSLMPSLALIFHVINIASGQSYGDVTLESTERAAAWCDYLESHCRRIYGMVLDVHSHAASILAQKIEQGKLSDNFALRDIYRKNWIFLKQNKDLAEAGCDDLVQAHWLRKIDTASLDGGKSIIQYQINPKIKGNLS